MIIADSKVKNGHFRKLINDTTTNKNRITHLDITVTTQVDDVESTCVVRYLMAARLGNQNDENMQFAGNTA